MARGYASIGLYRPKNELNVGSAMRAASCYGASMIAISGRRYRKAATDTSCAWRHIPTIHTDDLFDAIPFGAVPVAVEFIETAMPLVEYVHPERAFYIFGPEDGSIPKSILDRCRDVIYVPTSYCMNLAATVNVILYDRMAKSYVKCTRKERSK